MRRRWRTRPGRVLRWSAIWAVRGLMAAAVLTAAGGVLLLVWQGPWWLDSKRLTDKDLTGPAATLITGFRTAVVQVLVALGAVVALWFTWRNYRLTRRGQVTDRFIKALERLGSDEMYVRYCGVLALEQILHDAPDQATHAAQVLGPSSAAAPQRPTEPVPPAEKLRLPDRPDEDVQAALTALTRPTSRLHVHRRELLDLSDQHLAGAQLAGADLSRAWLNMADLTGTRLYGADLTGAWLRYGADLRSAKGLTVDQVVSARPDHTTQLPAAIAADPAAVARIEQLAAEREAAAESQSAGSAPAAPRPD